MRLNLTRDFYIPKGYTAKVSDKHSDAVTYLWNSKSNAKPGATIFFGKQAKPYSNFYYRNEQCRQNAVALAFESRRKSMAFKSEQRQKRKDWVCPYKVGDIFRTCWGYDQANVEYYEIVELKGKHAILRELSRAGKETGFMQGECVPLPGKYVGEPMRRLCQDGGFKISSCQWASYCAPKLIGGVPVYDTAHWTAYA